MPLLSIIVPNYNNEAYIKHCLDSILQQTFSDYEVIIADDCSTDGSPAIIREYEKKHPGVIRGIFNKKNMGVSANRHNAVMESRGRFLTTMDSDDYYYNRKKLSSEMALIHRYKAKGIDIIAFSNVIYVTKDKKRLGVRGKRGNICQGDIFKKMLTRSCEIPLNFIFPRPAYDEIGSFDPEIPIYEDWDMKLRLATRYHYYYTGLIGTAVTLHGTGLSSKPAPEHIHWLQYVFDKNIPYARTSDQKTLKHHFQQVILQFKKRHIRNEFDASSSNVLENSAILDDMINLLDRRQGDDLKHVFHLVTRLNVDQFKEEEAQIKIALSSKTWKIRRTANSLLGDKTGQGV